MTWKKIACLVTGHRWVVIRRNIIKSVALAHLHSMAGEDANCERCGAEWRDSGIDGGAL